MIYSREDTTMDSRTRLNLTFLLTIVIAAPGMAQTGGESRPPALSEAEEIALARSAAPARVSEEATILVLRGGVYVVGATGNNDNTCMVARSQARSLEPICYDPEASRTVLPIELRRFELRRAGITQEKIDGRIEAAIAAGELPLPSRPAMAYMMSSGQVLYSDEGKRVGQWYPHLHVYYPYLRQADVGLSGEPSLDAPIVVDAGEATSSIVIIVRDFVYPLPATSVGAGGG